MKTRRRRHPKICPCSPDVGDCPKCKKVIKRGKFRKTQRKV